MGGKSKLKVLPKSATTEERFWAKVDKSGDCWEWRAGLAPRGYGQFNFAGHLMLAHRASYLLTHGSIPDGLWVLHHCDNPACVRPDHLFLGTGSDNMRDMHAKGRHPVGGARGTACNLSKLTEAQVMEIRQEYAAGASRVGLSKRFGVHTTAIWKIAKGLHWRHLPLHPLQEEL